MPTVCQKCVQSGKKALQKLDVHQIPFGTTFDNAKNNHRKEERMVCQDRKHFALIMNFWFQQLMNDEVMTIQTLVLIAGSQMKCANKEHQKLKVLLV